MAVQVFRYADVLSFNHMRITLIVFCWFLMMIYGCWFTNKETPIDEKVGVVLFDDVTEKCKVNFIHQVGDLSRHSMPLVMGSGGAMLDVDNDGLLDLYLLQNVGPKSTAINQLFKQRSDHTFEDISAHSGLDFAGYGMSVAVGDMDNDGFVDVYVSQFGGGRLFRNRGVDGKGKWLGFEEVTKRAGVDQPRWGTACAFLDYDRDGFLDLVVVNYVDYDPSRSCGDAGGKSDFCHPSIFPGTATRLYRNRGVAADNKWLGYEDVTVKAGLSKPGTGLGVLCTDMDGDGWIDILIANDARPNHLWINQKNGTFKEEAVAHGIACNLLGQPQANMGIAWGDVDRDGFSDVFITHLTEETHTLWKQGPRGLFLDGTSRAGLAAPRRRGTGFGTVLIDFDHDGWLDLAVVNGRVARGKRVNDSRLSSFWQLYAERNQLFLNDGNGTFSDISPANEAFCGTAGVSRGLIWGDYDNDGAMDLLVTSIGSPARLFRNVAEKRGRWLMLRAFDPNWHRDAIGARIEVRAGKQSWVGEVCPSQSYLSSGDMRVHFGLGKIDAITDVRVTWPDGSGETFDPPSLDKMTTLYRGKGRKKQP